MARCSVENSGEIEALVPAAQDADAAKAEAAKATAAARAAAAEPVASDGNVTSSKCDHCTLEDTNRDQLEVHDAACIGQCIYIYPNKVTVHLPEQVHADGSSVVAMFEGTGYGAAIDSWDAEMDTYTVLWDLPEDAADDDEQAWTDGIAAVDISAKDVPAVRDADADGR